MGKYTTLRYVDNVGANFLFRGGMPLADDGTFDYAGLTAAIDQSPSPVPLPSSYYLVDISLLHPNETTEIAAELTFFWNGSPSGQLNLWDTNGTPRCYFQTDPIERDYLVTTLDQWLDDPLIWRVATLRKWLETSQLPAPAPAGMPIVFYVHCDGGCDRTAELIGAYRLRYMGDSWAAMWEDQPCGRPLGCNNYRALQWYALWLNATLGFHLSGIGEDSGCYDPGVTHRVCSP